MSAPAVEFKEDYLQAYTLKSWLLTTDHKRIGLLYMASITLFFFVGGGAATVMRLELLTPQGDLLHSPDAYNRLFTMHGVVMIFFFLIPSIPSVLGNFLIPLMIGARDLAFPWLNLLSWYIFMVGGSIALWILIFGGVDTGWTFYTPFSTMFSNTMVVPAATAVFITGFSSILTGMNFIVTIHTMRCPGLTWFRLPLFVWSLYATSLIMVLGTPVLAIAVALVAVERLLHVGIFDPALGGDPILFQHLFWFYSHPAVYIMVLPGMGVVSEIIPCFCRRPIFGYRFIAYSSMGIAVLGFLVWGHHMFVSGQSMYAGLVFSMLSFLVAIPSGIKVFNWTSTLYKGSIRLDTPMLYALGFIGLFTIGGLTGLMLASLAIDVHVHDTYFVVAHFHYIMVGGTVMAYLGGIHFWWPKLSGRMYPELLGKLSALTVFVGFNLTFFPQFVLGYLGMPRRYYEYPPEYQVLNVLSTAGASILAFGYVLPLLYLLFSLRRAPYVGPNPWHATGLEWQTDSPPPVHNFDEPPVVTLAPYAYYPARAESSDGNGSAPARARSDEIPVDDEPILSHQFDDVDQQSEASALGMWLFLATEVMFFGGLLTAFAVYRRTYPDEIALASRHLNVPLGCWNTVVLLSSSLTMALAVRASQLRAHRPLLVWLGLTMALGTTFLGIKAVEYTQEYHEKLIPGWNFEVPPEDRSQVERQALDPRGMELFFVLYFFMTGLHAIHLVIGIGLVGVMAALSWRRWFSGGGATQIEVTGLYWHFIDIIWVFLYPLLYLIDVHR